MRLVLDKSFTVAELVDYLTSSNAAAMISSQEDVIQALNIIVGHNPKAATRIASLGSSRHHDWQAAQSERIDLGAGLLAIRGFFLSVRSATGRLLLNVQVKHAPFYQTGSLVQLMTLFMQSNGPNKAKLQRYLKGLSVNVTHIVNRNAAGQQIRRMKTIWGLATERDGESLPRPPVVRSFGAGPKHVEFAADSSGQYISVYKHFSRTYNLDNLNDTLPVVNVGTVEKPSYLPAEVCQIGPCEPFRKELSPEQTKNMIRFAVRKPADNARSLVQEGVALLNLNQSANPTHVSNGLRRQSKCLLTAADCLQHQH